MSAITKEQCIEFAQLDALRIHHWRLLTGVECRKDDSFIYGQEGIFPVQYTDEELSGLTAAEQFEIGEFCATEPLRFPCLPSELLHFIDNLVLGDFSVPGDFREAVERSMRGPDAPGIDGIVDWYNNTLSASMWFDLPSVAPQKAAMLLCRFNPLDERCSPLEDFNPETGPTEYKLIVEVFESIAMVDGRARTLTQWLAIARDKGCRYHSWIDEYVSASGLSTESTPNVDLIGGKNIQASESCTSFRVQRIGWKKSVVSVWDILLNRHHRKPTVEELVVELEKNDHEGYIVPSRVSDELAWRQVKNKNGNPKRVRRDTIEDFIGSLPGYRA